jgi:hypothetical protein
MASWSHLAEMTLGRGVSKGATNMDPPNTTRWIGIGLLGLPLYGALTLWSSIEVQADPETQLEA